MREIPAGARIVTLKGEVFDGNGVIIAGKENRAGVISRPRQKKDLQEQVNAAGKKLTEKRKELEGIQTQEETLQGEKKTLEKKVRDFQNNLQQVSASFSANERDLARLTQQLDWQTSQINTLVNQVSSAEGDVEGTQKEIDGNLTAIEDLNVSIREVSEQLRAIPMDEIQNQLVHWNTTQAVTERALKEANARVSEFEQTMTQNRTLIEQLNQRILDQATTSLEAQQTMEKNKADEEKTNLSIAEFSARIDPAETELRKLETEYSTLQHEYSQTQQFEANADRVYTQAQLEYSRSREALESLRRRIEEDFGLVTLEYSEDVTGPTPLPLEGVGTLVVCLSLPKGLEESITRQRALLRRMGAINPEARKEYQEVKERHDFLKTQLGDLEKADGGLASDHL